MHDVEIINAGLWNENGMINFATEGSQSSCVIEDEVSSKKIKDIDTIKTVTIDDSVGNEMVTFIKMDIEGAELKALEGAKNTIRRCKPKMAICVYHKPEDIIELPTYILGLVPE